MSNKNLNLQSNNAKVDNDELKEGLLTDYKTQ